MPEVPDTVATRRLVEEAKDVLMGAHGLTEADALRFISHTAMSRRERILIIAGDIVAGTLVPPGPR